MKAFRVVCSVFDFVIIDDCTLSAVKKALAKCDKKFNSDVHFGVSWSFGKYYQNWHYSPKYNEFCCDGLIFS